MIVAILADPRGAPSEAAVPFRAVDDLVIRQTRFGAPAAQALIAAAQADLTSRYGTPDESQVESIQFDPPEGAFLVAYAGGAPVACAGWRTLSHFMGDDGSMSDDVAEVKRMFVVPEQRGNGVAKRLLGAIEDSARTQGMNRLILETGGLQPEAIRFYEKNGYERIANYGHYRNEADCVSFGRDL